MEEADQTFNTSSTLFQGYCVDYFFDAELNLRTDLPNFTQCFQHTLLTWIPVGFFWIFTPVLISSLVYTKRKAPLKWLPLFIAKLTIQALIILATFMNMIFGANSYQRGTLHVGLAHVIAPFLIFISMIMILVLLLFCRLRGLITSGVLFNSLLMFVVFGFPEFLWKVILYRQRSTTVGMSESIPPTICYLIYYILICIQLILSAFADTSAEKKSSRKVEKPCPEKSCSYLNRMTFWWFNGLSITGWQRSLTADDLWSLNEEDSSEVLVKTWEARWTPVIDGYMKKKHAAESVSMRVPESIRLNQPSGAEKAIAEPSVVWTLFLCLKKLIIPAIIMKFLSDVLQFVCPLLLSALIEFVRDRTQFVWRGYAYAATMFAASMLYTFLQNYYFHCVMRVGMNLRTMLTSAVFTKSLKLSTSARRDKGIGETVNIMSTDIQMLQDVSMFGAMILSCPLQMSLALYFLYQQLGYAVFAGLAVIVVLVPFNYLLSSRQRRFQTMQMAFKDQRIKMMSEILNGIKVLKLYAWEDSFEKQILDIRTKELDVLKKTNYFGSVVTFTWNCAPFLVSVASFAVFVLTGGVLTPSKAFVSLSLFNILKFPMTILPMVINFMVRASVSNKRLKAFLCADELDLKMVDKRATQNEAIKIEKGEFAWTTDSETATLSDVNLRVEEGELVAVVGKVGCGKSSLLAAILGEIDKRNGTVGIKGSVAYVPQQPWVQNVTLRENITFLKTFDQHHYTKVVEACALKQDLDILPSGDATEIGEKGINLSGGQKQRVSLARAVYQNCDIFLLDDPLSAVDAHVGKHIFEKVISNNGMLKRKTRVLVTHGLTYLKDVDKIFVITDGRITETGTYKQLLQRKGAFSEILMTYLTNAEEIQDDEALDEVLCDLEKCDPSAAKRLLSQMSVEGDDQAPASSHGLLLKRMLSRQETRQSLSPEKTARKESVEKKPESSKLIKEEETQTGRVKWTVYTKYLSAMGYFAAFVAFALMAIGNAFSVGASIWLSHWSNRASYFEMTNQTDYFNNDYYIGIYTFLGIIQGVFVMICSLVMSYSMANASSLLHKDLLRNLFRSPMSFFDVTPLGRILNRCGKDIDIVDNILAHTIRTWLGCVLSVAFTMIVIVIALWYFIFVVIPTTIIYFFILRFYISTSRQLKRLESVTRSPIFSHFQETLNGVSSIRAFGAFDSFVHESQRRVDVNQACYYPNVVSNRWLAVRLELIGNLMVFSAALFAVIGRENFNGGQVGLAISYALSITQVLNWVVRMSSDLESNVVAVERIKEYSETPTEADLITNIRPPSDWPVAGEITFEDYSVRYREGMDLVLKNVDFRVQPNEKVGIVGRTGAGKSSVTLALFRILESANGKITIDQIDISKIGLKDLRSRLTIIPQDPVLFSGTLRMNLDPFEKHSDEEVWTSLERAHLKQFVLNTEGKLEHRIGEGGDNLSFGQRQLLCLARALLRKTKVLLLDEATAGVDLETDDLIQKTIRDSFADCTILTIAHRLNTIIDNSRILVLSEGKVAEFDTPDTLMHNEHSIFYAMAKDANLI